MSETSKAIQKNNYADSIKVSDSHKIRKSLKWIATNRLTPILAMTAWWIRHCEAIQLIAEAIQANSSY